MIKIKFTLLDKTMELVQEDKPKQYQTGFTEGDIKALNYERYHHPHPRVQRKMEALWLKSRENLIIK